MLSWLDGVKFYVIGGLLAIILTLSGLWYMDHLKIKYLQAENKASTIALSVSNASVKTLSDSFSQVNAELDAEKANEDKIRQGILTNLAAQTERDKSITSVQNSLKANMGKTPSCETSVPEDIKNAWKATR